MARLVSITAIAVTTVLTAMDGAGQSGARAGAPIDVTVREGTSMSVAVSPDGRTLAVDLQGSIWTVPVSGGALQRITDVFGDARHPYTRALSRSFPRIGDTAARYAPAGLPGDPPDPRELPPGCSFAPRCAFAVEECSAAEPAMREVGPGRLAACIRTDAVATGSGS